MRRVTTSDFQQGDWVEYSADGIRLINDIRQIQRPDQDAITIDMTIVVVCLKGRMTVTVDSARHTLTRNQIISHLLRSLVYEFLLLTDRLVEEQGAQANGRKQTTNDDLHRRFLELLAFSRGRTRKVEQFAEQLFVTPDQLTAATKAVSGRTALDWITEATVQAITHELLYTQKSVSEISDELDFPSLSFFGKYFKQHTGLSPRAFRERFGQE